MILSRSWKMSHLRPSMLSTIACIEHHMGHELQLIRIEHQIIKQVEHTKYLGVIIDAQVTWSKHVEEICKKIFSAIGALKRVRPFIPKEASIQNYNALIVPYFD